MTTGESLHGVLRSTGNMADRAINVASDKERGLLSTEFLLSLKQGGDSEKSPEMSESQNLASFERKAKHGVKNKYKIIFIKCQEKHR